MKTSKTQILIANLLLASGLVWMAGCASTGYESGEKAAKNIQAAANQIAALPGHIDATLASLQDLVDKPQPDLRPQYKKFVKNLEKVESTAKGVAAARQGMADKGKAFMDNWDAQLAQIKNEDIKSRSESRKSEVEQKMMAIKSSYAEAEMAFKPFMSDLKDVQKYLGTDLTTGGVAAIKDTVVKVNQESDPLKVSIGKLADDFKSLGVSMSSVTPPPAPEK